MYREFHPYELGAIDDTGHLAIHEPMREESEDESRDLSAAFNHCYEISLASRDSAGRGNVVGATAHSILAEQS